jgi:hypothetical protein
MTAAVLRAIETLTDAMLEALRKAGTNSTREMSRWVRLHYRNIFDQHSETLSLEGLDQRLRSLRKKQAGAGQTVFDMAQLFLDLGLPKLDLDEEVSVPRDMTDIVSGPCDWIEIEDVTVDHIDLHIELLDAKTDLNNRKTGDWRAMKQAMLRIGKGRTDIPMRELRRIALQHE